MDLEPSDAVDYFALELSNQTLYIPVLRRETRRLGFKTTRGSAEEARAALRLRAKATVPAETTARLAELQSRIRPHFLFNTLNTALTLVRLDPARAEGVLEDLSELFRVAIADTAGSGVARVGGATAPS